MGFGVYGLGLRVWGLGFRTQGRGLKGYILQGTALGGSRDSVSRVLTEVVP